MGAAKEELEYRILVQNRSTSAAHHVLVRNPVPTGARYVRASPEPAARDPELLWRLGTLEGGRKQEIVLVLIPTGTEDIKNCARVQFEHGECVTTKMPRPALKLTKDGPQQARLNDTLTYKLTLTNTGTADVTNVQLTDIIPAGLKHPQDKERLTWILSRLPAGQSQSTEYQVVAQKVGQWRNTAIATSAEGLRETIESSVTVTEPKLGLSISGPKQRYVNVPAAYTITVSNPGSVPLQDVVLIDRLPAQTTLIKASENGQLSGDQVQWSLGALDPGGSRNVEVVLQAQTIGRLCSEITASAQPGVSQTEEVCTDFKGAPALTLEVTDSEDPVEIGGTTAYNIIARNSGTSQVSDVRLVAVVPDQMEVVQVSGDANHEKLGQRVTFEPLSLAAAGIARYRVEVRARRAGDVRFKVELTASVLTGGPILQEESTLIYAATPTALRKSSTVSPPGLKRGK
jgi:uncharacterized repeat protein (TIGR01451 family)